MRYLWVLALAPCLLFGAGDPPILYVTYEGDPLTSATIRWVTHADHGADRVEYSDGEGWAVEIGSHVRLPDGKSVCHSVQLTTLLPGTLYRFRLLEGESEWRFRTLSADGPYRFVVGGDIYHKEIEAVEETNRIAAAQNPQFAVLGGDIAYSASSFSFGTEDFQRWYDFLSAWKRTMITSEGLLIPVISAIGNHEVNGRYRQPTRMAPYFYAFFSTPNDQGYWAFDIGQNLSVILLDSDHTHSINGEQSRWLKRALSSRRTRNHKLAVYHVPAYPSVRHHNTGKSPLVRKYWVPLFDEYGLDVAFEHHDHAYKRTHPLKEGRVDADGVLYLGDGGWGSISRPQKALDKVWYLEKIISGKHFILVDVDGETRTLSAISGTTGALLDQAVQRARASASIAERH